jgi:polysaccharide export outer membrane protein
MTAIRPATRPIGGVSALIVLCLASPPQAAGQSRVAVDRDDLATRPSTAGRVSDSDDTAIRTSYVLGADDQLVIQVVDVPEISSKPQRIDPEGDLRLPMVGRIHAAGMTAEQLEAELTTRLKVYLQEPDVAVTVTEFHSQPVSIIGAVGSAGVHQLSGQKTLIEMLSLAGGASAEAGPSVRVTRRAEWGRIPLPEASLDATGAFSTVDIDLKALLNSTAPEKNIIVRPNDVISVARAELVYVIGEVGRAGPVPLSSGTSVSVMEALSASGGVLRTAKASQARILRRAGEGETRTEIGVDLAKIMQGKERDPLLVAGDILVVPDSTSKRAIPRLLEAALQAGIMVGTYGIVR